MAGRMIYFSAMRTLLLTCVLLTLTAFSSAQCPTISVQGPAGITHPGEEMRFRAEVNVVGPKLSYSWSVNAGTIVKGQGTPEITIATTRELEGGSITATVEVDGLPNGCERSASEIAGVAPRVIGCAGDEWGELKPNEERGRLDLFFAELSNNPNDVGLIIFRVEPGEKLDPSNSRIQFVLKHMKFRKFDKSRIWFALENAERRSTQVWRMPPGAEPPCSECLIYRGESL